MPKKIIYLDNAATTPVDPAVFSKMKPYFTERYGNASSIHQLGQQARQAVEKSRQQVADFFGCSPEEIYFTSGATESDNTIKGIIEKAKSQGLKNPHIITSAIEHKAVLDLCQVLERKGLAELTVLPASEEGLVEVGIVEKAIKKNTALVSIMYANSEIGTVQPIEKIGQLIKKLNSERKQKIYFHTDAVQAVNYLNCKVDYLGVDLLSLSSHKIYGPKGIGVLYIRKGTPISSLIRGGGHERGVRSGTENVPGIVGLGEAVKKAQSGKRKVENIKKLRNKLITGILRDISGVSVNGSLK
ncbi:MAG: aminotransferase class V-fold PLP-dependent enzyme, partial [Candidatus Portnoybacteria bacterium]